MNHLRYLMSMSSPFWLSSGGLLAACIVAVVPNTILSCGVLAALSLALFILAGYRDAVSADNKCAPVPATDSTDTVDEQDVDLSPALPELRDTIDQQDVDLPPALLELRTVLAAELPSVSAMVRALGGERHCLERFLVAGAGSVATASTMFRATMAFRAAHRLDEPSYTLDEQTRLLVAPLWPGAYCGTTTDGCPLQYFRFGHIDPKKVMRLVSEEQLRAFYLDWMERSLRLQIKANANCGGEQQSQPRTRVATANKWRAMVEVHDMAHLSFSQLHAPGLLMLSRVLKLGQEHYPENMCRLYIINAPAIFQMAWSVVSLVLNASTIANVRMRRDDGGEDLRRDLGGAARVAALFASAPCGEEDG